ncbi:MAG: glycerol-3-phosphate 1-O-acyltransferase PlsY [Calditrichia bacterium]
MGSFPTAYLFSKLVYHKDILQEGSGNVGTLNFLRISKSKTLSVLVLIIDMGKGFLIIWIASKFLQPSQWVFPVTAVILGHIYPVWLKGKGGRGLATLAGVFLFLKPLLFLLWWVFFGVLYLSFRKYIVAGVLALLMVNVITLIFLEKSLFVILSAASVIVFYKYIPRVKEELTMT